MFDRLRFVSSYARVRVTCHASNNAQNTNAEATKKGIPGSCNPRSLSRNRAKTSEKIAGPRIPVAPTRLLVAPWSWPCSVAPTCRVISPWMEGPDKPINANTGTTNQK